MRSSAQVTLAAATFTLGLSSAALAQDEWRDLPEQAGAVCADESAAFAIVARAADRFGDGGYVFEGALADLRDQLDFCLQHTRPDGLSDTLPWDEPERPVPEPVSST